MAPEAFSDTPILSMTMEEYARDYMRPAWRRMFRIVDSEALHRRIFDSTPLCVFAGLSDPPPPGDPAPEVTDDLDAVTCRECLRFEVD